MHLDRRAWLLALDGDLERPMGSDNDDEKPEGTRGPRVSSRERVQAMSQGGVQAMSQGIHLTCAGSRGRQHRDVDRDVDDAREHQHRHQHHIRHRKDGLHGEQGSQYSNTSAKWLRL